MRVEENGLCGVGLFKSYGQRFVVSDVTIKVRRGEVVGLLGPNGAGKTTAFSLLTGFIRPDKGKVFLAGVEITDRPVYQRAKLGIGYLPQEPSVFRKLTVEENILAVLELIGQDGREMIGHLLAKLGISHLKRQKAGSLSGGERRKVELARALVTKPLFLLLDEPFTGIDPIARQEIQDLIRGLAKENLGILVTDHNVRETLEITERAYLIYDSRILFSGTAQELISNEEARRFYLGEGFRI